MNHNAYDPIYYVDERNVGDSSSRETSIQTIEEKPTDFSWTVSEFLQNADQHFKTLGKFYVYGEISEISSYNHMYFKLKDETSTVDCVMWNGTCRNLNFVPKKGDKVEIISSLSLYVKNGQFKLVANSMRMLGLGTIIEQLNILKQKLSSEGVFDLNKRELPRFINTVGIITSSDGRAFGDIVKTIKSRNNLIDVILYPSLVQGKDAPRALVNALNLANEHNKCDVIIFGRGGGSFEDLLCFYDESVVRAVANSRIPIISAVGHEADVAFTDFAADKRAATPTRAAEFVTPFTKQDLICSVDSYCSRINNSIGRHLDNYEIVFDNLFKRLKNVGPQAYIGKIDNQIELFKNRINSTLSNQLSYLDRKISEAKQQLSNFEPNTLVNSKQIKVNSLISRLDHSIDSIQDKISKELNFDNRAFILEKKIEKILSDRYTKLNRLVIRNSNCDIEQSIQDKIRSLTKMTAKLTGLNPMYILCQGYSVTVNNDGSVIDSNSLTSGAVIKSILKDSTITSKVVDVKKENNLDKTGFGDN